MPRVLIVEDDRDTREMLGRFLELEGFEVSTAANGQLALDALRKARASVIVLDLMMPVMDGPEALAVIRAKSSVPVVLCSGYTSEAVPEEIGRAHV